MIISRVYECDVLVVGAGPAGVCAAISAARNGMNVILTEQGGFSGGMATRGLVVPFMTCSAATAEKTIIRTLS